MKIGDLIKISSFGDELHLLGIYMGDTECGERTMYYCFDSREGGEFANFDDCFWLMEVL